MPQKMHKKTPEKPRHSEDQLFSYLVKD